MVQRRVTNAKPPAAPPPTPKPLTPKQLQALQLLSKERPTSAPMIGGLRIGEALVARGFVEQGPLVVTSMTQTTRGISKVLQPSYKITEAGKQELRRRAQRDHEAGA